MKKLKVLVVPSDRTGVSYYRSTNPHIALENNYPNEFHVDVDYEPQLNNDEWLKQYDIIHYHRTLGNYDQMGPLLEKLNSLGIVTNMDLDDYWSPGEHHPAYHLIKAHKIDEMILNNIKLAKNVTTTTSLFANEIAKYNKNVHVLANAINPSEKQFTPNLEPSNGRLRIGWLGGSSHLKDLEILKGIVGKLKTDGLLDKVQFVLCGFDIRGTHTEIDQNTGQQKTRNITPMESVWYQYERIFTDDYKTVSPEHKDFLMKFIPNSEFDGVANEAYRRVWTKPISTYATNYNLFDVSYTLDVKNAIKFGGGFEEDGNGILIDKAKNHKDWYSSIKKLIQNPDVVKQLQDNLYNTVKDTYSLDKVTEQRRELYINLVNEKKGKTTKKEKQLA